MNGQFPVEKIRIQNQIKLCFRTETPLKFVLNPNFFLTGTNLSLKVQARMKDKVRIKNLKSLFEFFEKFSRVLLSMLKRNELLALKASSFIFWSEAENSRGSFLKIK